MQIDTKDLINYLSIHPNDKLFDYVNFLKEQEDITRNERKELLHNRLEWYKALVGRYFIIDFNGCSYCVVYIDKLFTNDITTKFLTYDIYRSSVQFSITKENRPINRFWLNCPYEDECFGKCTTKVKEITKEEFDKYTKIFESQKELFNSLIVI